MATLDQRIDVSDLTPQERADLPRLLVLLQDPGNATLTTPEGQHLALPGPVYRVVIEALTALKQDRAFAFMPEDETFTTQAAANFLGMSRQHLVTLLESGEIPFHRVGAHRRVQFRDLRNYADSRSANRRQTLDTLFGHIRDEGLYDNEDA